MSVIKQRKYPPLLKTGLLCLALILTDMQTGFAHQQKEAYITLLFNQNTGRLEISHRFFIHDAEHIVVQLKESKGQEKSVDFISNNFAQSEFASYVEQRFKLAGENLRALPLNSVGYEIDGKYFWVYQETDIPDSSKLNIKHSAMQELWPAHINHINVETSMGVYSVRLGETDIHRWRTIPISFDGEQVSK